MKNGNPLSVLQTKLAEHAADLLRNNFISLKDLVSMIQSLEGSRHVDDESESNESRLQRFLRGEDINEPAPEGAIQ